MQPPYTEKGGPRENIPVVMYSITEVMYRQKNDLFLIMSPKALDNVVLIMIDYYTHLPPSNVIIILADITKSLPIQYRSYYTSLVSLHMIGDVNILVGARGQCTCPGLQ